MSRMLKPVIFFGRSGRDTDENVRDFRPANLMPKPQIETVALPEEDQEDSGGNPEGGDGEADPKDSSVPGSASTSGTVTSDASTPPVETNEPPSPSVESVTPAGAEKVRNAHPSGKSGSLAQPALVSPSAPSKVE